MAVLVGTGGGIVAVLSGDESAEDAAGVEQATRSRLRSSVRARNMGNIKSIP